MSRLWSVAGVCAVASVAIGATPRPQVASARVYVTVVDPHGAPVENAPVDAFHVWEDGVERRVVGAERATQPLAVTIVVHGVTSQDTQAGRRTITGLLDAFRHANAHTRVAVMTAVSTPRLVDITAGADQLANDAGRFYESGPGFVLFEAVESACKILAGDPSDRRAVFAVDNALAIDHDQGGRSAEPVAAALERANASLWVLQYDPSFGAFRGGDLSVVENAVNPEKDRLVSSFTIASGGSHDTVAGTTALPDAAARLATLLLSQYAVTYERPASARPGKLQVGVAWEPGTKVMAPQWAPK